MTKTIHAHRPTKGGLVVGHQVFMFFADSDLPVIRGKIIATSQSGATVTVRIDPLWAALGLSRKSEWTWRAKTESYVQKGARAYPGDGLAIIARDRGSR